MFWSLASTIFLMGLLGGAHCLAMCAAPCAALTGAAPVSAAGGSTGGGSGQPVFSVTRSRSVAASSVAGGFWQRTLAFHLGRLLGYGAAGALAALAMDRLAWLSDGSAALRPVWTLMHVLIIAWGLLMLVQARQPLWLEQAGRSLWARVQPLLARPGGLLATGLAWALLPCGLLYTALLTAALSGSVLRGALSMALFALGSGLWLLVGPLLWRRLRHRWDERRLQWGARLAGLVLCVLGGWALWMDVVHQQPAPWCLP